MRGICTLTEKHIVNISLTEEEIMCIFDDNYRMIFVKSS